MRVSGPKRLLQLILDQTATVNKSVSDLEVKVNTVNDKLDEMILESQINNKHNEIVTDEILVEEDV